MQNPNEDTEWNDALRKHGVIGPRQATEEETRLEEAEATVAAAAERVQHAEGAAAAADDTLDDLDALLEEVAGDDEEEARRRYREKRIAEMKEAAGRPAFGEVINITANDYVKEVNEAGKGVWVVLLLYSTDLPVCRRLQQILAVLACKHKHTKFVQSVGQNCIPNYPDRNLPTIFIYYEGELSTQFIGPRMFGGESMSVRDVEWGLAQQDALETDIKEDPRKAESEAPAPLHVGLSASARKVLDKDHAAGRKGKGGADDDSDSDE
mmetsp:Transcript_4515/g.11534  ORF Transcript_4515/g.11534 Transcript_4515/m.11534 type:complete len:266 (+) Transcript_4515:109-906(+)